MDWYILIYGLLFGVDACVQLLSVCVIQVLEILAARSISENWYWNNELYAKWAMCFNIDISWSTNYFLTLIFCTVNFLCLVCRKCAEWWRKCTCTKSFSRELGEYCEWDPERGSINPSWNTNDIWDWCSSRPQQCLQCHHISSQCGTWSDKACISNLNNNNYYFNHFFIWSINVINFLHSTVFNCIG